MADAPYCADSDVNGGTYIGPIGMAGWSPLGPDNTTVDPVNFQNRQAAIELQFQGRRTVVSADGELSRPAPSCTGIRSNRVRPASR